MNQPEARGRGESCSGLKKMLGRLAGCTRGEEGAEGFCASHLKTVAGEVLTYPKMHFVKEEIQHSRKFILGVYNFSTQVIKIFESILLIH